MKRGDSAREAVKNKIINAFGDDFVGIIDKKIYVEAKDDSSNETIQFAITMTMPKTPVTREAVPNEALTTSAAPPPADLTPEDKKKIIDLMEKLNLTPDEN